MAARSTCPSDFSTDSGAARHGIMRLFFLPKCDTHFANLTTLASANTATAQSCFMSPQPKLNTSRAPTITKRFPCQEKHSLQHHEVATGLKPRSLQLNWRSLRPSKISHVHAPSRALNAGKDMQKSLSPLLHSHQVRGHVVGIVLYTARSQ